MPVTYLHARAGELCKLAPVSATAAKPRPQADRAAATKRRILEAALAEFAEKGLAGARVDEIADRAGVNKRMIYAYFGSKEDLWLTVLERAYAAKRDEENALRSRRLCRPARPWRGSSRSTCATRPRTPSSWPCSTRRTCTAAPTWPAAKTSAPSTRRCSTRCAACSRAARPRACSGPGVDPMQLYVTLVGIGHFYVANHHTLSNILGAGLMTQAALGAREAHCIAVILGYLRP